MRRKMYFPIGALALLVMGMVTVGAFADEKPKMAMKKGKSVTVEGLLIDTKCYGMNPMNWKADHMAKTVKVTGTSPYKGAIIPDKVFVKNKKGKWEEVKMTTMM